MKVRKARIANVYTVLNLVDRKLELGFVIQFYDNDNNLGISFKEEHEGDLDTFYSLMELYHGDKLCFLFRRTSEQGYLGSFSLFLLIIYTKISIISQILIFSILST